jgi:hypothetical protein
MRTIVVLAAAACGCASFSTLQTASTVPKGEVRAAIAPQVAYVSPPGGGTSLLAVPLTEVAARIGVSDNADVGVRAGNGGAELSVKAQARNGDVTVAIAPAFGVLVFHQDSGPVLGSNTTVDLTAGLDVLFGLHRGPHEVVLGPKLLFVYADQSGAGSSHALAAGGVLGVAIQVHEGLRVMPEINIGTVLEENGCPSCPGGVILQGGLGLYFGR